MRHSTQITRGRVSEQTERNTVRGRLSLDPELLRGSRISQSQRSPPPFEGCIVVFHPAVEDSAALAKLVKDGGGIVDGTTTCLARS